jgi:hypothetical protein
MSLQSLSEPSCPGAIQLLQERDDTLPSLLLLC